MLVDRTEIPFDRHSGSKVKIDGQLSLQRKWQSKESRQMEVKSFTDFFQIFVEVKSIERICRPLEESSLFGTNDLINK